MADHIENVHYEDGLPNPHFIKPGRLQFERKISWEVAFEMDSVSIVLFNVSTQKLILVKQFRPAVFARAVMRLPENAGKRADQLDFGAFPMALGETLELCAGLADKPGLSLRETASEEVREECGFDVPAGALRPIKSCVDGVSTSGARHHIFFAAVSDAQRVSAGGGNASEGEFIELVSLSVAEARRLVQEPDSNSPPSLLFGLSWFLAHQETLLDGKTTA